MKTYMAVQPQVQLVFIITAQSYTTAGITVQPNVYSNTAMQHKGHSVMLNIFERNVLQQTNIPDSPCITGFYQIMTYTCHRAAAAGDLFGPAQSTSDRSEVR